MLVTKSFEGATFTIRASVCLRARCCKQRRRRRPGLRSKGAITAIRGGRREPSALDGGTYSHNIHGGPGNERLGAAEDRSTRMALGLVLSYHQGSRSETLVRIRRAARNAQGSRNRMVRLLLAAAWRWYNGD